MRDTYSTILIESGCISCLGAGGQFKNDEHYFCGAGVNRPDG